MSLCIAAGGATVALAVQSFVLVWTHSVEKTEWTELWRISPAGLVVEKAWVRGSGAGMEPPAGSVFDGRAWTYRPALPPQPELHLMDAGLGRDWRLCAEGVCRTLRDLVPSTGAGATLTPCERAGRPFG